MPRKNCNQRGRDHARACDGSLKRAAWRAGLLLLAVAGCVVGGAHAQECGWTTAPFEGVGTDGVVLCYETFDAGDGLALFAGGGFDAAGATPAHNIAAWNGTAWAGVGDGFDSFVYALAAHDDGGGNALYAGGDFTHSGAAERKFVARWPAGGGGWAPVGAGFNAGVTALLSVPSGPLQGLYAGGYFNKSGATNVYHIARWNGAEWLPVGPGLNGPVHALAYFNDALYAGGDFTADRNGNPMRRIAMWDGASWNDVGGGVSQAVRALAVYDAGDGRASQLYAGGYFTAAGDPNLPLAVRYLATWDGAAWADVGNGAAGPVLSLGVWDGLLAVGGTFASVGNPGAPTSAKNVALWNGATWTPLGDATGNGTNATVEALLEYGDQLLVGGWFTTVAAGSSTLYANYAAAWTGSAWLALGGAGLNGDVRAMLSYEGSLYVAGDFTTAGSSAANHVARWDGAAWAPLGAGLNGPVYALTVWDPDEDGPLPAVLVAGGAFNKSGTTAIYNIAKWDGVSWAPLGANATASGLNRAVYALAVFNDALHAGGEFYATYNNAISLPGVGRWNGTTWASLGSGLGAGKAYALATYSDGGPLALYVGGAFSPAGGGPGSNIAKWSGTAWAALDVGVSGPVYALGVYDDGAGSDLYVGGDFAFAGGLPAQNIAQWNGYFWSPVGTTRAPGLDGPVYAMATFNDFTGAGLYVGGKFNTAGGMTVNNIVKWQGNLWWELAGGTGGDDPTVFAIAEYGSTADDVQLYVGGRFTTAGGQTAAHLAAYRCEAPGACCHPDETCEIVFRSACADLWLGPNTTCEACPCVVCHEYATLEAEPCGEDTNGGCNATPALFEPIACGQTICGTAWSWSDGYLFDTDWYQLTTSADTAFALSGEGTFPLDLAIFASAAPDDCSAYGIVNYSYALACEPTVVPTDQLPPGTYWFTMWAFPTDELEHPCPQTYEMTLTCLSLACPADVETTTDLGTCEALVQYDAALPSGGVPPVTVTYLVEGVPIGNPHTFPLGTTTVTATATDSSDPPLLVTCTFTVTVVDDEAPVIGGCPANIEVSNDFGFCSAEVAWDAPTASDNCDGALTPTGVRSDGLTFADPYPVGVTTVTYTVTDTAGNAAEQCVFTVTVTDDEDPVIECPSNVTVTADAGVCQATGVALGEPQVADNCGIATVTNDAAEPFPVGVTTVTWTVTDIYGNSATCTQTVTVTDDEAPVISNCPADIEVLAEAQRCSAQVHWQPPTAQDNCGLDSLVSDYQPFDTFPVGETLVTYTATDIYGNVSTCTFTVRVLDLEDPTIVCPLPVTVTADPGACSATGVDLGDPIVGDNCGIDVVFNDAPSEFPVGDTIVTWTVIDVNGNENTCQQIVTVRDDEAPTITCPPPVFVNTDPGQCYAAYGNVNLGTPAVADNCGVATVTNNAFGVFPVGTTTVTWTVTDIYGHTATCEQTVTVTDAEVPSIACPTNVTVNADAGVCFATDVVLGTPAVGDNCAVLGVTNDAVEPFPVGTTTVTWTVEDIHGNFATCVQTVTVLDQQDPTITCPAPVTIPADSGECFASLVDLGAPTVGDDCGVADVTNDAPAQFPVGTTIVTWTVTDLSGNTATCTQLVTVTDDELPTITCPADVLVGTDAGQCYASAVALGTPVTGDNCGVASVTNNAPPQFPTGLTVVTWTVTDLAGNAATCDQTVTVEDATPPVAMCQDIDVFLAGGTVTITPADVDNGSYDACGAVTLVSVVPDTFTLDDLGANPVVLTVQGPEGLTSTCTAIVVVHDDAAPTALCQDITVQLDALGQVTITPEQIDAGSSDPDGPVTLSLDRDTFTCADIPSATVTLTVTDTSGNVATCTATVTVEDVTPPVALCKDIDVNLAGGTVTITPADVDNGSYDACGAVTLVSVVPDTFTLDDLGANPVVLTVQGPEGLTSTCTAIVVVHGETEPVAVCQDITVRLDETGQVTITPEQVDGGSFDPDGPVTLSVTPDTFTCANIGINAVTLTVVDGENNVATCTAQVTVEDKVAPNIVVCPPDRQLVADEFTEQIALPDMVGEAVATDNCDANPTVTQDPPGGTLVGVGLHSVKMTVTDDSGNMQTCNVAVLVVLTTGACCLPSDTCSQTSKSDCQAAGGAFQGGGTTCAAIDCSKYCVGDLNCDGAVDFVDLNPFVQFTSSCATWQAAYPGCPPGNGDVNGNGQHSCNGFPFDDINAFVSLLSSGPLPITCP